MVELAEISDEDFPITMVLEVTEPLTGINDQVVHPRFIHVTETLLMVAENTIVEEGVIHLFSRADDVLLGSFGRRGQGPNEFGNLRPTVHVEGIAAGEEQISLFDWTKKILTVFSATETIATGQVELKATYQLPVELIMAQEAVYLDTGNIVGSGVLPDGMLFFVDMETDEVSYTAFFPPKTDLEISDETLIPNLYRSNFTVNRSANLIIAASLWFPQILFVDFDGTIRKVVRLKNRPDNALLPPEEWTAYYTGVMATDSYIYVTYYGFNPGELEYDSDGEITGQGTEIQVVDLNGTPVRKLVIPNYVIPHARADQLNSRIILFDENWSSDPFLYIDVDFSM